MPTTPQLTFTWLKLEPAKDADLARTQAVKLIPSTSFTRGEILGEIGTTGVYAKFNPAANDGTQIPKCIIVYTVTTDASGVPSSNNTYPYPTFPDIAVPAYYRGTFDCALVTAAMGDAGTLLNAAIAAGFGHFAEGDATIGTFTLD